MEKEFDELPQWARQLQQQLEDLSARLNVPKTPDFEAFKKRHGLDNNKPKEDETPDNNNKFSEFKKRNNLKG